jgi:hypothetical protein
MYQYNYFYFCHLFLYGMRHTDTAIPSSNGRQFGKMLTTNKFQAPWSDDLLGQVEIIDYLQIYTNT